MKKIVALVVFSCFMIVGFNTSAMAWGKKISPQSTTNVKKANAKVEVGIDGLTTEQINVKRKLEEDSKMGAIKYLSVISAYSGQVIFSSVVDGKVTSSGKRITVPVKFSRGKGGGGYSTDFVTPRIGDDGTYGSSVPYLYWWDTAGKYHQHFVSGGSFVHVSDKPFRANSVIMNMEVQK